MDHPLNIRITQDEIIAGIRLAKCQKCGCMRETLDQLTQVLPGFVEPSVEPIKEKIPGWLALMQPVRYACLGCEHCYAGAAQNAFTDAFPQVANSFGLSCEMRDTGTGWPLVVGEYIVVDITAPVAIATLASLDLGKQIVDHKPRGLSIVGKLETENIGIDKLIKNVIANSNLCYLVLAGEESQGHQSGQTLLALSQNGVDENGRVIGSSGKRPVLHNVTQAEIDAFRKHIQIVDMIGCQDIDRITQTVSRLSELESQVDALVPEPCGCAGDT